VKANTIPAGCGLKWLRQGWRLFAASPGPWMVMTVVYGIVAFVLSAVPLVGSLALALAGPGLSGGFFWGARELQQGRPLEVSHLFQAFIDRERTGPMLSLGLVSLAGTVLMSLVTLGIAGSAFVGLGGGAAAPGPGGLWAVAFAVMVWVAGSAVLAMALCFAVPLVMFGDARPWDAVRRSFSTTTHHLLPLTVYGLIIAVLGVIAVLPLGLGLLVVVPLGAASLYASLKDLFPAASEAAP